MTSEIEGLGGKPQYLTKLGISVPTLNTNVFTCSQAFNVNNTLKNVELKTLCMPVPATLACLNISHCTMYEQIKFFHSVSVPKLTTGQGNDRLL